MRHVWVQPGELSTLDLLGPGLTLFADSSNQSWAEAVDALRSRVPISLVALEPVVARSLGVGAYGAALVRPDGLQVAAWSSSQGASSHLAAAVDGLLAGPPFPEANEVTAA